MRPRQAGSRARGGDPRRSRRFDEQRRLAVEQQLAGDAADVRIGERRDELAQRVGREHLPRVGEHENVEPRARATPALSASGLPAGGDGDDVDERPRSVRRTSSVSSVEPSETTMICRRSAG